MIRRFMFIAAAGILLAVAFGCSNRTRTVETLHTSSMSSLNGVITRTGVAVDSTISSDGDGSLRLTATGPTTFRLYDVDVGHIEKSLLIYRAKIRTEDVRGSAYLEMWCSFPGKGEFFSRALHDPVSGTTEWVAQQTPFMLQKGQYPDGVKLNLVLDGTGTVWIDDIELSRTLL